MPTLPLYQVDAFSNRAFAGNPAAVCPTEGALSEALMQDVAGENNLSETAFFHRQGDGYSLRWFTPTVEVDLCGHATLASAHRLWEAGLAEGTIRFHTRSGVLTAARDGVGIELDFPALPPVEIPPPPGLEEALRAPFVWVGKNAADDFLVEMPDERSVRNLESDFAALSRIPARGVVVTALAERPAESGYDFVSRFFAPRVGIDEDPVTGSAHVALAPFWSHRLGRSELV